MTRTYDPNWIKHCDPKPGKEAFALAESFARKGTKAAFALAMFARKDGATNNQVKDAVGQHQQVLRGKLVKAGRLSERREKMNGQTIYRISLPAKSRSKPAGKAKATAKGKIAR